MSTPYARVLAVGLLLASTGCSHLLTGAKQDVTANKQAVSAAAQNAGTAIKAVPENAAAATVLTPEIKLAFIRDPVLNDKRNVINVSTQNHVTHLTGHVADESMKQRAAEDVQAVIGKRYPDYTISNELTVTQSGG